MDESELRKSVVLITGTPENPREVKFGTGFIIHRNDQGTYVVTCAHVVNDVGGSEQVKVEDFPASVVALGSAFDNDLAILSVDALRDRPVLHLGVCGKTGSNFITIGYQKEDKPYITPKLEGILGDLVGVRLIDSSESVDAWYLKITNDQLVKGGNSGSPVVDKECGKVIAVVSHLQDEGKKGFAFSITALTRLKDRDKIPIALLNEIVEELSTQPEIPMIREVVDLEDTQEHLLTKKQLQKLISLLCELPNINYANVRHSLVSTLPAQYQNNIDFDMPLKDHITEIVDTVASDPDFLLPGGSYPIMVLIQNALDMMKKSHLRDELQLLLNNLQNRHGVVGQLHAVPTSLDRFTQYLENFILQTPAIEYELKSISSCFDDYILQPDCEEKHSHLTDICTLVNSLATLLNQSSDLKVKAHRFWLKSALLSFNNQAKVSEDSINRFCEIYGAVLEKNQPVGERPKIQQQLSNLIKLFKLVLESAQKLFNELH